MVSKQSRRRFTAEFKFRVAIAATKGDHALAELSSRYEIQATQIQAWQKQLLDHGKMVFDPQKKNVPLTTLKDTNRLERKIGDLTMANEFLMEKLVPWIDPNESR